MFNLMQNSHPFCYTMHVVVGRPIEVVKNPHPTPDEVKEPLDQSTEKNVSGNAIYNLDVENLLTISKGVLKCILFWC